MKKIIFIVCIASVGTHLQAQEYDTKVKFKLESRSGRQVNSKNENVNSLPTPIIFDITFDHKISAYRVMSKYSMEKSVQWFISTDSWETTFLDKGDVCYSITGIFRMENRDDLLCKLEILYNMAKMKYSYMTFKFQSGAYILFDNLKDIK